jgi:maleylpyruvate isomerase
MFDHVTLDPLALTDDLRAADDRLFATIAAVDVADPSLLPGWTRGHVLSHLARNADALGNLLIWARTGVETLPYATPTARVEGIEEGASRPLAEQVADLRDASARFLAEATAMPVEAWSYYFNERQGSAAKVVWRRLREVEVHHVDLGLAYTTADWPDAFTARLMRELVSDRTSPGLRLCADSGQSWEIGAADITVSGPAHELAGWLSGRSSGADLTVSPFGPLPTLPDWI